MVRKFGLDVALDFRPVDLRSIDTEDAAADNRGSQRGLAAVLDAIIVRIVEQGSRRVILTRSADRQRGGVVCDVEIGRASCRKRVWISVVAVSLKKKSVDL